jgi:glutathione synthase/RimK-type ligase-like ATP-grasp enzyme
MGWLGSRLAMVARHDPPVYWWTRLIEKGHNVTIKVGLLIGREQSFPPAFLDEVNRRDEGVVAELMTLGGTRMDEPCPYAVIIDRISHEVPYYRIYLKSAVLQGVTVVNNPFMWTADDKFFEAALATKLGIASPKTIVLPNKEYVPGIAHPDSLRNLIYPLNWQAIIDYVGLPCILKDALGSGWKDVYICQTLEELVHYYNLFGLRTVIVQEFIEWQQYVRCICLGQEEVLPIKYNPHERQYYVDHHHLSAELGRRIVADSLTLMRALGYDMNTFEWAIRDGIPYAIDFMNLAPEMDINVLTPFYFDWAVKHMADMVIRLAKHPRPLQRDMLWSTFFSANRIGG